MTPLFTTQQVLEFGQQRQWKRWTSGMWKSFRRHCGIEPYQSSKRACEAFEQAYEVLARANAADLERVNQGDTWQDILAYQQRRDSEYLVSIVENEAATHGDLVVVRDAFYLHVPSRHEHWTLDSVHNVLHQGHLFIILLRDSRAISFSQYHTARQGRRWVPNEFGPKVDNLFTLTRAGEFQSPA